MRCSASRLRGALEAEYLGPNCAMGACGAAASGMPKPGDPGWLGGYGSLCRCHQSEKRIGSRDYIGLT